eukprot:COSAG01_NODE_14517_length_1444_cov_4.100454_5_plen_57_part_01
MIWATLSIEIVNACTHDKARAPVPTQLWMRRIVLYLALRANVLLATHSTSEPARGVC